MAANILNSPRAVVICVYVVRAFAKMRENFATNAAILTRLAEIDKTLLSPVGAAQSLPIFLQSSKSPLLFEIGGSEPQ